MSRPRGAYQRRPSPSVADERWEPCYTHGYAATFFQVPRGVLYTLVRNGQIPGPVLVGGRIRWPHSLLVTIRKNGLSLPGTYENDPRRRPTLGEYRDAVNAELEKDARAALAAAEAAVGRKLARRRKGVPS